MMHTQLKQRALWTALALALGPTVPPRHFLPLSFHQQIQSLIKGQGEKRGREETGDRGVKRATEIDMHVGGLRRGGGRKKQVTLYLAWEAAAQAGAPVCLLPLGWTPSSTLTSTSARAMKSCHGNTPGSEINNLSTSSEKGNL